MVAQQMVSKETKETLNFAWCQWAMMGIAAPGIDLESTCFLRRGRLPCAGSESTAGDANQLFSVACTPVKTVWPCVSWKLIFLLLFAYFI